METERYRFQVINTPGHSPDHVCLFEPEQGWRFSGDAYIGGQDRALREGYDIHGIIASLKKSERAAGQDNFFRQRHGAHGRQTAPAGKSPVPGRAGRKDPVLHNDGLSARRIRGRVLGRELPITFVTLGHFSGLRLVQSCLAGFEPLASAGAAGRGRGTRNPTTRRTEGTAEADEGAGE